MSNPTPTEVLMELAHAIQYTVGHRRSIEPDQHPITDEELTVLRAFVVDLFDNWRTNGTSK